MLAVYIETGQIAQHVSVDWQRQTFRCLSSVRLHAEPGTAGNLCDCLM